jgi:hypothetical protein
VLKGKAGIIPTYPCLFTLLLLQDVHYGPGSSFVWKTLQAAICLRIASLNVPLVQLWGRNLHLLFKNI